MVKLEEYQSSVNNIRSFARKNNIRDEETSRIFQNCFKSLEKFEARRVNKRSFYLKIIVFTLLIISGLMSFDRKLFTTTLMRNLQNSIYPGLKILRTIAIPIVERYPSLSEYYDEWCLLENPYFYISDMDCWPCSMVQSIPDLTDHNISRSFNLGIPYTKLEKDTTIQIKDFYKILEDNAEVFKKDAARVSSNNSTFRSVTNVVREKMDLKPSESLSNHITWRINRMRPGRILRKLFPKPIDTPNWWEQSIEKFIFIDEPKSPSYSLPNPECSNIVIRISSGARLIKMVPSAECLQSCKSSTILLSSGNTLWYNWWYWRPISRPVLNSTEISISYLTSFC